ncbi:MAG: SGNH/GDSL hydrolase family protein [Blastocatellia bacterium]
MDHFLNKVSIPLLLPFLLMQGLWVRLRTPRLPGAAGPCSGAVGGEENPFALIVIGESPVAGIGAPTHETAITGQTASALSGLLGRGVIWRAFGLSGATAGRALREIVPIMPYRRADAVVIALGVNDVIHWHGISKWSTDLEGLIAGVRERAGDCLIVLTGVPPLQYFPALPRPLKSVLGQRARLLDRASVRIAAAMPGIIHVSSQFELTREFFCEDGFHPSEWGYAQWGRRLAEIIASAGERARRPYV